MVSDKYAIMLPTVILFHIPIALLGPNVVTGALPGLDMRPIALLGPNVVTGTLSGAVHETNSPPWAECDDKGPLDSWSGSGDCTGLLVRTMEQALELK